jgi:hypothetical protein
MSDHDFVIQHKKGSEMPADFLSQNVVSELNVSAINIFEKDLKTLQAKDPFIRSVSDYIQFGKNPLDTEQSAYVRKQNHLASNFSSQYASQKCFAFASLSFR